MHGKKRVKSWSRAEFCKKRKGVGQMHQKNCPWSEDIQQQYHDNVLDKKFIQAFETHLFVCASCREALKTFKNLKEFLREKTQQSSEAPFLKDLERRVLAQIQEEKIIPFPRVRFLNFSKAIAAAAVFLIAFGGYWHFQNNNLFSVASSGKNEACEVDYFYSQTKDGVLYYNLDDDTKVIWVLDESAEKYRAKPKNEF
jgi:hypothetical protein